MKFRHRLSPVLCAAAVLVSCKPAPAPGGGKAAVSASTFTVKSLTAERSGDHLHLTLTAQVKNPGAEVLTLSAAAVKLMTADGRAVEPFIAPGLEPAVIAPGSEAEAATHWWLAAADLAGALTFDISGARAEVKSAAAFALDLLPESRPVALSFPDWKLP